MATAVALQKSNENDDLARIIAWLETKPNAHGFNNRIIANFCKMATLTGLRYSDLSALTFEQVQVNGVWRNHVDVVQQKSLNMRLAKGQSMAVAKKGATVRVELTEQAHQILTELDNLQGGTGLIFKSQARNAKGQAVNDSGIRKILKEAATALALPYTVSLHTFRKTFAVRLLTDHGHTIASVRDRLGHSNVAITDRYLQGDLTPATATSMAI